MEPEDFSYSDDTYFSDEHENAAPSVVESTGQKPVIIQKVGPKISKVGSFTRLALKDRQAEETVNSSEIFDKKQAKMTQKSEVIDTEAATSQRNKIFSPVTHVIFDLDGTLLDTETINNRIISGIAAEYNKEYTPEIRNEVMGRISSESSKVAVKLLGLPLTPEEFYARLEEEDLRIMSQVNLMPGAEKLIRHLYKNEVPMAVATSSSKASYDLKSTMHKELFKNFHHIVAGGSDHEVMSGKPAPDIYLICASRFPDSPKPHSCLAFEDSPNGVTSAMNAGMQVIMIPDPSVKTELHPTLKPALVLESFDDFHPELFGLPGYGSD